MSLGIDPLTQMIDWSEMLVLLGKIKDAGVIREAKRCVEFLVNRFR